MSIIHKGIFMHPAEVMLRHIDELIVIHDDPDGGKSLLRAHPEAPELLREVRSALIEALKGVASYKKFEGGAS